MSNTLTLTISSTYNRRGLKSYYNGCEISVNKGVVMIKNQSTGEQSVIMCEGIDEVIEQIRKYFDLDGVLLVKVMHNMYAIFGVMVKFVGRNASKDYKFLDGEYNHKVKSKKLVVEGNYESFLKIDELRQHIHTELLVGER